MDFISFIFNATTQLLYWGFIIILAILTGLIAISKGRSAFFWGILALFFPFITTIIVFILPSTHRRVHTYFESNPIFTGKDMVISSIMALSAIIAKADGQVTRDEVQIIRTFLMHNFRLSNQTINAYSPVFDYGKNHPEEKDEFIRIILSAYPRRDVIMAISYLFIMIGYQGGSYNAAEDALIREIVIGLGLTAYEYESIKNQFAHGASYSNAGGRTHNVNTESREDKIRRNTKILGIPETSDLQEVKKAYRKLAKEYHPDKVISEGMPPEYIEFANKRFTEITDAYEELKELLQ